MCFSAGASLSAAAVLAAVGAAAVRACPARRALPYAAIPLLFALQQLAEGVLWLALLHDIPWLARAMSQAFTLFAHVLWPAYIPLAALLLEPQPGRRTALAGLAMAGAALAVYYLVRLLLAPVWATPEAGHIEYHMQYVLGAAGLALYLAATAGALLVSSWRRVRRFGWLVLAAFALTWWAYARWLVSVWCFFAALLSIVVLLQLAVRPRAAPAAAR